MCGVEQAEEADDEVGADGAKHAEQQIAYDAEARAAHGATGEGSGDGADDKLQHQVAKSQGNSSEDHGNAPQSREHSGVVPWCVAAWVGCVACMLGTRFPRTPRVAAKRFWYASCADPAKSCSREGTRRMRATPKEADLVVRRKGLARVQDRSAAILVAGSRCALWYNARGVIMARVGRGDQESGCISSLGIPARGGGGEEGYAPGENLSPSKESNGGSCFSTALIHPLAVLSRRQWKLVTKSGGACRQVTPVALLRRAGGSGAAPLAAGRAAGRARYGHPHRSSW